MNCKFNYDKRIFTVFGIDFAVEEFQICADHEFYTLSCGLRFGKRGDKLDSINYKIAFTKGRFIYAGGEPIELSIYQDESVVKLKLFTDTGNYDKYKLNRSNGVVNQLIRHKHYRFVRNCERVGYANRVNLVEDYTLDYRNGKVNKITMRFGSVGEESYKIEEYHIDGGFIAGGVFYKYTMAVDMKNGDIMIINRSSKVRLHDNFPYYTSTTKYTSGGKRISVNYGGTGVAKTVHC